MKDTTENNTQHTKYDVKGGDILLAAPLLNDPNFKRGVILIVEQEQSGGYFGLMLNRRLDITLSELCQFPGEGEQMFAYTGGPVDLQRMFWIHTLGNRLKGSVEILPGLYIGGDYDELINLFISGEDMKGKIRFFLGYAGWTKGQLENEIKGGAWKVFKDILDPQMLINTEADEMWPALVRQLGESYRHWLLLPADPALN